MIGLFFGTSLSSLVAPLVPQETLRARTSRAPRFQRKTSATSWLPTSHLLNYLTKLDPNAHLRTQHRPSSEAKQP